MKRAIKKYGQASFTKEILYVFQTEEDMNAQEKLLVTIGEHSYNLCPGGDGGFGYINANIPLRIEKNRKARRITNSRYAHHLSEWGKRGGVKVVQEKAGLFNPKYDILRQEWAAQSFKGKTHTEEAKRHIGLKNSIHQQGSKNSNYGRMWITEVHTQRSKTIPRTDPIPDGWIKGRKIPL